VYKYSIFLRDNMENTMINKPIWPALTFGPVNLWTLPPAWWFYMTSEEKAKDISNTI
jgi:hypothetical protein